MRTLVGNGKQALTLVARALRDGGTRAVLVPRYHCGTMVLPFTLEGVRVHPVDVGADLQIDPASLVRALAREPGAAVLHCETYGNRGGRNLAAVLAAARRNGSALVLDATHSLIDRLIRTVGAAGSPALTASGPDRRPGTGRDGPWDAVVASMRKLLPVPDGARLCWSEDSALATGLERVVGDLHERGPIDETATALGVELHTALRAMSAARGIRRERLRLRVCEIAAHHEDAIEAATAPVPASATAAGMLEALDPEEIKRRALTAHRLRESLEEGARACGLRVANPGSAGCVALRDARGLEGGPGRRAVRVLDGLEEALAHAGLWGPVSWPDPGVGGGRPWPRVVTVPTDAPKRTDELVELLREALGAARDR